MRRSLTQLLARPLLLPGAALAAGGMAGLGGAWPMALCCVLASAGFASAALLAAGGFPRFARLLCIAGCFLAGAVRGDAARFLPPPTQPMQGAPLAVEGVLVKRSTLSCAPWADPAQGRRVALIIHVPRWPDTTTGLRFRLYTKDHPHLLPGARVLARGEFRPQHGFFNGPADHPLARFRLDGIAGSIPDARLSILAPPPIHASWRQAVLRRCEAALGALLPPAERDLCLALTLGATGPDTPWEPFREAGLLHLLVVSGYHLTLMAGLIMALPSVRQRPLLALPPMVVYAWLCGFGTPILRALIMAVAACSGLALHRRADPLNSLSLAAAGIVLLTPTELPTPGFAFSFAVTAALLLGPRGRGWLAGFQASVVALAGVIPVSLYHFGCCNLLTALATPVAAPLAGILLATALAALPLICLLPFIQPLAGVPLLLLSSLLNALVGWLARFPLILTAGDLLWFPPLAGLAIALRTRRPTHGLTALALLLPLAAGACGGAPPARISFLDVGQGDCAIIEGGGARVMVDTGDSRNGCWRRAILPLLRRSGIRHLNALFVTHLDDDHSGNAGALLAHFPRCRLYLPAILEQDGRLRRWLADQRIHRRRVQFTSRGEHLAFGEIRIETLSPAGSGEANTRRRRPDDNAASLILLVRLHGHQALFMGDAPAAIEERIARAWPSDTGGELQLLKASHHGSRDGSSAPFLRRLRPRRAILSRGRFNRHGHPHRETILRLAAADCITYDTAKHGMIRFNFRPGSMMIPAISRIIQHSEVRNHN